MVRTAPTLAHLHALVAVHVDGAPDDVARSRLATLAGRARHFDAALIHRCLDEPAAGKVLLRNPTILSTHAPACLAWLTTRLTHEIPERHAGVIRSLAIRLARAGSIPNDAPVLAHCRMLVRTRRTAQRQTATDIAASLLLARPTILPEVFDELVTAFIDHPGRLAMLVAHPACPPARFSELLAAAQATGQPALTIAALARRVEARRNPALYPILLEHAESGDLPTLEALLADAPPSDVRRLFGILARDAPMRAATTLLTLTPERIAAIRSEDLLPLLRSPMRTVRHRALAAIANVSGPVTSHHEGSVVAPVPRDDARRPRIMH